MADPWADENGESPVVGFATRGDWYSPPAYPIADASRRPMVARSASNQNQTPPPLPRCELWNDASVASPPAVLSPDWNKIATARIASGKKEIRLDATPLPRRHSVASAVATSQQQQQQLDPHSAAGLQYRIDAVNASMTDADWELFYVDGNARGSDSPRPTSLADIPDLPPATAFDPLVASPPPRSGAHAAPAAARADATPIGVRPAHRRHADPAASAVPHASANSAPRRRQLHPRGPHSPDASTLDAVMDRVGWQGDFEMCQVEDGDDVSRPTTEGVDFSPYASVRREIASQSFAVHVASPEPRVPAPTHTSPSPPRRRSRVRMVVAIIGAVGLTAATASLIGLGASGAFG
jgi:hypothetical protein